MTQKANKTKKNKNAEEIQIADLEPKKDPKGGIIGILIDLNTSSPKPPPPPPPPTTK